MALGNTLRETRERLGLTASQVAAATRMKVQTLEAIEREDFSKIAAPIYGKGFIKLYAEELGIDWRPLVEEYVHILGQTMKPKPAAAEPAPRAEDSSSNGTEINEHGLRRNTQARADSTPDEELDLFARAASQSHDADNVATRSSPARETAEPDTLFEEPAASTPKGFARWFIRLDAFLSGLDVWRSPMRAAALVLGVVLILVFIVSALSRCLTPRRPADAVQTPRQELQVVVQPPEPYFE